MANKNKEIQINSIINIKDESKVIHASSFGVGGDDEEVRLIIVNNKLINKNDNYWANQRIRFTNCYESSYGHKIKRYAWKLY